MKERFLFIWKDVKFFLLWMVLVEFVFISGIVHKWINENAPAFSETIYFNILVLAILVTLVIDSNGRYNKFGKK